MVQDRDQWQDLVKTVMHRRVPKKAGNFLTFSTTSSLRVTHLTQGLMEVINF
jgi:hypothetical protein